MSGHSDALEGGSLEGGALEGGAARKAGRRGQATTEWMLLVAVVVVAVVAAGYGLAATFGESMEELGDGAGTVYTSGDLGN